MYATQQDIQQLKQQLNGFAAKMRADQAKAMEEAQRQLDNLAVIASALSTQRAEPGGKVIRIEDIPGRRIPYEYIVDIPIGNNTTSDVEQSVQITQEGPFVAVKRFATFQSALSYQVAVGTSTFRFQGRTYGRYRPIHSAWDLEDARPLSINTSANPLPVGALQGTVATTSSASSGRSMVFDGRVLVQVASSSTPRSNLSVPTPFWSTQINSPQELGALDFFERGETITFRVSPTHVNNPPFGNASGDYIFSTTAALGSAQYPFTTGQFDPQEGIVGPGSVTVAAGPAYTGNPSDAITRLPDGVLTIGFLGYKILQPIGPVLG